MIRGESPDLPLLRFKKLSKKTGGLPKGHMIIIGARTSNGKTAMALNLAYDLAIQNKKVLFLSLEMTIPRLIERLFCMEYSVHNYDLKDGTFAQSETLQQKWDDFSQSINTLHFVGSDMIGKSWAEIDEYLKRLKVKPDVIFIDHIQEIRGVNQKVAMDEYLKHLRTMCIRDNFALVICSQCSRLVYDEEARTPQLHHLKYTGFLEESADIVLLLHWPWHYDNAKDREYFEVNLAKNRDGETGYLKLKFHPQWYRFEDPENKENEPSEEWS